MNLARIRLNNEEMIALSIDGQSWHQLNELSGLEMTASIGPLLQNPDLLSVAVDSFESLPAITEPIEFLCPVQQPEKIICIGKNYADHAQEMGGQAPESPVVFSKFNSTLIGPDEPIVLPTISDQVDFEAELVVVIGKPCRFVAEENALDHVFGYTIGNDVSARDWQKGRPGGQWLLGKTFDTFAPVGPFIITADSIGSPSNLDIELKLNQQTMQSGNTSQMIFSVEFLISHLSQFVTLRPGDLIFTGTPAGVGHARIPPVYLHDGDHIEIQISRIGKLCNPVVAAK